MFLPFSVKKINNSVYHIKETFFSEAANMFLIKKSFSCLLIDCGIGLFNIKQFLNGLGFENIKLFLTHSHFDHSGGIKFFEGKEIIIANKQLFNNLKNKNLWAVEFLKPELFSKSHIKDKTVKDFCKNFKIEVPLGLELYKKTIIHLGNHCFVIVGAPGHTDDSVILFDKNKKIIISGDALYQGKPYFQMPNSNIVNFRNSLNMIKNINPDICLAGHNKPLNKKEIKQTIHQWLLKIK